MPTGCVNCGRGGCSCARRGPTGPTGTSGATGATGHAGGGPTGPTGPAPLALPPIGMLSIVFDTVAPESYEVTDAALDNPDHPGARFLGILFSGSETGDETRVILPKPATLRDAYVLLMDTSGLFNLASVRFANDAVTGKTCRLIGSTNPEEDMKHFVEELIEESQPTQIRVRVLVTPDGVGFDPGFAQVS